MTDKTLDTKQGISTLLALTAKFLNVLHRRVQRLEEMVENDVELSNHSASPRSPGSSSMSSVLSLNAKATAKKPSELLQQTATFLQVVARRVNGLSDVEGAPKPTETPKDTVSSDTSSDASSEAPSDVKESAIMAYTPPTTLWTPALSHASKPDAPPMKKKIYLFTWPQCVHCQALAKEWARFTDLVNKKYANKIELLVWTKDEPTPTWAKGLDDEELLKKYHVHGYPHIIAEDPAHSPHLSRPYTQKRSAEALEAWLLSNFGFPSHDGRREQHDGGDQDKRGRRVASPHASSKPLAISLFSPEPSSGRRDRS
jgi:protein-disulfide isomerase